VKHQTSKRPAVLGAAIVLGRHKKAPGEKSQHWFCERIPYMGYALARPAKIPTAFKPMPDECSNRLPMTARVNCDPARRTETRIPVASWIIHPRHRAVILAFYNFVRTADDIADHATLAATTSSPISICSRLRLSQGDSQPEAVNLRRAWRNVRWPTHALDVLTAFRMDSQASLRRTGRVFIHYCRFGHAGRRFMLDVHARHLDWAASGRAVRGAADQQSPAGLRQGLQEPNASTAARRAASSGASVEALALTGAGLVLQCLHALAARTEALLGEGAAQRRGEGFPPRA